MVPFFPRAFGGGQEKGDHNLDAGQMAAASLVCLSDSDVALSDPSLIRGKSN